MISFGPVPSRRLGKSLGINNIVAPKTCSYNCIYCQAGRTISKSSKRESFFKPELIYDEVVKHLDKLDIKNYPDYLTFVSNGEPTLDINLGKAVKFLKRTGIPIAVITNSSMIPCVSVMEDLSMADWVSLKVDAVDIITWNLINRPADSLYLEEILKNICLFKDLYKGILCTETMLAGGINSSIENISPVAEFIKKINPLKAYLSIPIRPPSESFVKLPDAESINLAWQIFKARQINAELLTGYEGPDTGYTGNIYDDILNITAVHPLREDSLIKLLENDNSDYGVVNSLIHQRLIKPVIYEGNKYYVRDFHPLI